MRIFAIDADLAPAQITPFGLHPRVSLVLLLAAVGIALIGLFTQSGALHRVTSLCQGVIFGLLFSPQLRIWLPRAPALTRGERAEPSMQGPQVSSPASTVATVPAASSSPAEGSPS